MGYRFEESQLWGNSFGAEQAGEQLWGAALGSSFGQLSGPALRQLRGTALEFSAFGSNFEEQLWGATVGSNFAALQQHWRTVALKNDSFGE